MFALYHPQLSRPLTRLARAPPALTARALHMEAEATRVGAKFTPRPRTGKNTAADVAQAAQAAQAVLNVDDWPLDVEYADGQQGQVHGSAWSAAVGAVTKVIGGGFKIPKRVNSSKREGAGGTASQPARPPRCAASPAPLASLPAECTSLRRSPVDADEGKQDFGVKALRRQREVAEEKEPHEVEAERRMLADGERRAREAREAEKRARERSQREADRATTRGSAPKRGRPEESVDLTSDGDEDAAEPSHPPSRPRTTSQGPATQPCPPARAASGPTPAPADTGRAAGRQDGSASASSTWTRSRMRRWSSCR